MKLLGVSIKIKIMRVDTEKKEERVIK